MGVEIIDLQLQRVDAPAPVADAFLDVQRARADEDRLRNEAEAYRNDILPKARGDAQRMLEEAEGYKQARVLGAEGEVNAYNQVYNAYKAAPVPEVMKERLYQETMQEVLASAKKVIADPKTITYLPLPGFKPQTEVKP
jgi:membrane protease subunit HflK